jgi:hypothetical protein
MTFNKWFDAQFGKRPKNINMPDHKLQGLILGMVQAQQELRKRKEYDAIRAAALYAWQVKGANHEKL